MSVRKEKKEKKEKNSQDILESLLDFDQFSDAQIITKDKPVVKNLDNIGINPDTDKPEEIIRKLIGVVKKLNSELQELKIHAEGTYCTSTEFNRTTMTMDTRIDELTQRLDMLEMENE